MEGSGVYPHGAGPGARIGPGNFCGDKGLGSGITTIRPKILKK